MRTDKRLVALSLLLVPAALACNAIIGTRDDLSYDPNAGEDGGGGGDATTGADGMSNVDGRANGNDGSSGSEGGSVDAGTNDGDPCGANLLGDKNNCGACGQDCSNGVCDGGVCTLTDQQFGAGGIAVGNSQVYVAVFQGRVVSCGTNGCAIPHVLADDPTNDELSPARLRLVNGGLYYSNNYEGTTLHTGVYGGKIDGGPYTRITPIGQSQVDEFNFTNDGGVIFWAQDDDFADQFGFVTHAVAGLSTALPDAGTNVESALIWDSVVLPNGAFAWASQTGVHYCASPPNCTSAVQILTDPNYFAAAIAYDDATQRLIIGMGGKTTTGMDKIYTCPATATACTPTVVASGLDFPRGVAAQGGVVYWTEGGHDNGTSMDPPPQNGRVAKCTLKADFTCGNPTVIAQYLSAPNRIALDSQSVYWTNEGKLGNFGFPGSVMKAPR
jgi:hypothetical protein